MVRSHQAPRAVPRPTKRVQHGDTVVDEYAGLSDPENPEVRAHLEAENAWFTERTAHLESLQRDIASEIQAHTCLTDQSVPVRRGNWWYFTRTFSGKNYGSYFRLPAGTKKFAETVPVISEIADPHEQLIFDLNLLAEGQTFTRVANYTISPDEQLATYAIDHSGDEVFDLVIRDIATGTILDTAVRDTVYGLAWTADSQTVFYVKADAAWRSCEIWRHQLGTAAAADVLVLKETDERFSVGVEESRDGRWVVITAASTNTSQSWLIAADDPEFTLHNVADRVSGVEYYVEPAGDTLLIVHNRDLPDSTLAVAPLPTADSAGTSAAETKWQEILRPQPGERFLAVDAFADYAALSLRTAGQSGVRILRHESNGDNHFQKPWQVATDIQIDAEDAAAGVSSGATNAVHTVELGNNPWWESPQIRVVTQSLVQVPTVIDYDPRQGSYLVRKRLSVPGYDPANYRETRLEATASDGTQIPISLVHQRNVVADGTAPGLLYGYGAYEISVDPTFVTSRISLLDRGVVFAIAHIRGGGELGRAWYESGRTLAKRNTFTDFLTCADYLVETGWVAPDRLAAEGRSAGGLLMGAVANLDPARFRVIHAGVPFVDALNTILDPTLPLTIGEWEEWGNPGADPEIYEYMKSYTPYENIRSGAEYPAILATTGLNDTRVSYVEPTKWVARLRQKVSNDEVARPILLRCEMVAGHGGRSGREAQWQERAGELAFLLDQLGATELIE